MVAGGSLELPGYPRIRVVRDRDRALRLFHTWGEDAAAAVAATRSIPLDDPQILLFDPRLRGPDFLRATLLVDLPSQLRTWEAFLLESSRFSISRDERIDRILAHCAWQVRNGVETELSLEEIVAWAEPGARLPGARG